MAKPAKRKTDAHDYPRPLLVREQWTNLNGQWEFSIGDAPKFESRIIVPFAPETPFSGVRDTSLFIRCWYRRRFDAPRLRPDQRLILHFGAVDYETRVWVNDRFVGSHEGGYTPFSFDITDELRKGNSQVIVVRADDDPTDLSKPRGKQDWQLEPHSIWYPRTTGIWQTVWLEVIPSTRIASVQWSSNVAKWSVSLHAGIEGASEGYRLAVRLRHRDSVLVEDACRVTSSEVARTFKLSDPGIDDARNALLWFPHAPNLVEVDLELLDADGHVVDRATSYTAMRSVGIANNRFIMNGRPMKLRMALDQGYWRQSGLTAPNDDALRRDVELAKKMGFNTVRKHQKIEDPRYLYWADRLGLMVWEEMPSAYAFDDRTIERVARQWSDAVARDSSHQCIICWVPLNESWGVPDLPHSRAQRDFVTGLYHLTKALDPTRPVIGNDGWENVATDIIGIHDYDGDSSRIGQRYHNSPESIKHLLASECPGNKALMLDGLTCEDRPIMLTEFGGIAYSTDPAHTWGYRRARSASQFKQQLSELMRTVHSLPLLAGFCYTQFADTYQEANGLLTMDRKPKIPIDQLRRFIENQ